MSQYLAFDLGASSGRAILGSLHGDRMVLDELHRFVTPLVDRDGRLFWDIDALWDEVRRGLDEALRVAPELRSVSVDSWAVDYVPLGRDASRQRGDAGSGVQAGAMADSGVARALRDAHAYRDPRTRGRLEQALALVPAEELYRRTGIQLLEINTLYQLLADLDEEPELLRETTLRLPIADYLHYRLTGRAAVERTMASTTQLMDVSTGEWAIDLIRRLGLPDTGWPEIVPPATVLGPLAIRGDSASMENGGSAGPVVIAACSHDTAAAVAAVPALPNDAAWAFLSSGTWSLLGVERDEPVLTDAALRANFTNEAGLDDTVRFLKNLTGLWVLQECERTWHAEVDALDSAALIAEAAAAPAPPAVFDLDEPRFADRGDMPNTLLAACHEIGIPAPATRGALVRLILESLAAAYARALGELEHVTGQRIEVLHVVGGGSNNQLLCQLTANACARRVIAGPAEAAALGNLLVQARSLGELPAGYSIRYVARASSDLRTYDPVPAHAAPEPTGLRVTEIP